MSDQMSDHRRNAFGFLVLLSVMLIGMTVFSPYAALGSWEQMNGPEGGIMNVIAVDPADRTTLYAGGCGGGVFKSTNSGASWRMLSAFVRPSEQITDLFVSSDGETILALADSLYKSTDSGVTWTDLFGSRTDEQADFTAMAVFETSPLLILVGSGDGEIYKSADGGTTWTDISGDLPAVDITCLAAPSSTCFWAGTGENQVDGYLYRSDNSGSTWDQQSLGQASGTFIGSVLTDPDSSSVIYVGFEDTYNEVFDSSADTYLIKSTDGGTSWSKLILPNTDTRVDVMGKSSDGTLYVGTGGMLYRSGDQGRTWTQLKPAERNGDLYNIAIDSVDPRILYLPLRAYGIVRSSDGGSTWSAVNTGLNNVGVALLEATGSRSSTLYASSAGGEGLFKSGDRGATWTNVAANGITHPWGDEIRVSPHDSNEVWFVADLGDVFKSTTAGNGWSKIIDTTGSGFRYGSIYAMAVAPSDDNTIYALKNGFGIFKSTSKGARWSFLHSSEVDYTYTLAVHPSDPGTVYSGYSPKPFQEWAWVRKTVDGGTTWTTCLTVDKATGVTSVVIDPVLPTTVYAGSTGKMGGMVWKSTDSGTNWSNVNSHFSFVNVHTLAADPEDPDTAYAGIWGGGVYRTLDGCGTWEELDKAPTRSASAILIDPGNTDIIYLADRNSPKIYRSADGGATWSTWHDPGTGYYRVLHAALSPARPGRVYTSVFTHGGPMAGDVFRIDDGTATSVTGSLPRLPVFLAVDPSSADTVYAVLHGYGVYKTTDAGSTWTDISGSGSGLPQSPLFGFNFLAVAPDNSSTLYLAGGCDVDMNLAHTGASPSDMNTVYRSTDGGATWTNLNDGHLGTAAGSIKGVAVSPSDSRVLFAGALNGVFESRDGGATWQDVSSSLPFTAAAGICLNSDGSQVVVPTLGGGVCAGTVGTQAGEVTWDSANTLFTEIANIQLAVDPEDSDTLYASAYPGGLFKSTDAGTSWMECNFGLASFDVTDPNRQGYYAFAISSHDSDDLFLGLYGVGVYRSQDGGGTWEPVNGTASELRGAAVTALLVDSAHGDTVYVGTENGVYVTVDKGDSWTAMNTGLSCTDIKTLAQDGSGTLYAGTRGYEMYGYDSTAGGWTQLAAFANHGTFWPIWDNRPLYQYTSLLFHPTDKNILYMGTFPAGVFKSTDGGQTWREKSTGWTNDGVFTLVCHPDDSDTIYAGTYNGVNLSTDAGATWTTADQGWPDEQWVFSIDFDPDDPDIMFACSKNGENEGRGSPDSKGVVMKTVDGGENWRSITPAAVDTQEFYKIIVDPNDPDILYLATERDGVLISYDAGTSWSAWNDGLTNTYAGTDNNNVTNTMLMSADGERLYFGTAGSGIFRRCTSRASDCDETAPYNNVCDINMTGITVSGTFTPDSAITFDADADSQCSETAYRFAVHPYYGTSGYDGKSWTGMTAEEWVSQDQITYTFGTAGKYVVVVWADRDGSGAVSKGIPIAGLSVDVNTDGCRTNFSGYAITGNLATDTAVTFTVNAENSCDRSLYYRFSYHPFYGTTDYNGMNWTRMTDTEWVAANSVSHTFTVPGRYIVVVWATDDTTNADPAGIPIIGWAVDIE